MPDSNAGLDQELDRLAERVDQTAAAAREGTGTEPAATPSEDSEMLNFATTDPSELDFDMDLGEAPDISDTGAADVSDSSTIDCSSIHPTRWRKTAARLSWKYASSL